MVIVCIRNFTALVTKKKLKCIKKMKNNNFYIPARSGSVVFSHECCQ